MKALKQQILALTTNENIQAALSEHNSIELLRANKDYAAVVDELRKHLTLQQIENYDVECMGVLRSNEETYVDDIVENILLCCKYNDVAAETIDDHFDMLFN